MKQVFIIPPGVNGWETVSQKIVNDKYVPMPGGVVFLEHPEHKCPFNFTPFKVSHVTPFYKHLRGSKVKISHINIFLKVTDSK